MVEDDPDIENDPDMVNAALPSTNWDGNAPREYMRFLSDDEAETKASSSFHDKYSEDAPDALQAGVVYCTFGGPVKTAAKKSAAKTVLSKMLKTDLDKFRNNHPTALLVLDYWQLPHKIAAIAEGFNQVHADPDEYAVTYAILKGS